MSIPVLSIYIISKLIIVPVSEDMIVNTINITSAKIGSARKRFVTMRSILSDHVSLLPLTKVLENYGAGINRIPVVGTGNEADKRHHYS